VIPVAVDMLLKSERSVIQTKIVMYTFCVSEKQNFENISDGKILGIISFASHSVLQSVVPTILINAVYIFHLLERESRYAKVSPSR
jgi:hypothetical protein